MIAAARKSTSMSAKQKISKRKTDPISGAASIVSGGQNDAYNWDGYDGKPSPDNRDITQFNILTNLHELAEVTDLNVNPFKK